MSESSIDRDEIEQLLSTNPTFDSFITETHKYINQTEDALIYETCLDLKIDPDIVKKQAVHIIALQKTLEKLFEKQTPKNAIDVVIQPFDVPIGLCPICKNGVNGSMNYCDECGQALNWP